MTARLRRCVFAGALLWAAPGLPAQAPEPPAEELADAAPEDAAAEDAVLAPAAPRDEQEQRWRERLEGILARREFSAARRASGLEPHLPRLETPSFVVELRETVRRLFDWIEERLRRWRRQAPEGDPRVPALVSGPAAWILAAAALALVGVVLWRARRRRASPEGTDGVPAAPASGQRLPDALSQPVESWARLAEQFARQGEWRLALHALYLKLLALLHERGAIGYQRQRTNGDYVLMLAGGPAGEPFRRLTLAFDQAWYGNKPFDAGDYRTALDWTRAIDQATARPARPGAQEGP